VVLNAKLRKGLTLGMVRLISKIKKKSELKQAIHTLRLRKKKY